MGLSV
jgi:hypothetical protein